MNGDGKVDEIEARYSEPRASKTMVMTVDLFPMCPGKPLVNAVDDPLQQETCGLDCARD